MGGNLIRMFVDPALAPASSSLPLCVLGTVVTAQVTEFPCSDRETWMKFLVFSILRLWQVEAVGSELVARS